MMVKLNFKLAINTFSNWIDLLTILWDSFLQKEEHKLKSKLFFRNFDNIKNFSYLCQLTELCYYFPYAYFYSKVIIILSIIYLILRVRAEYSIDKEEKGF